MYRKSFCYNTEFHRETGPISLYVSLMFVFCIKSKFHISLMVCLVSFVNWHANVSLVTKRSNILHIQGIFSNCCPKRSFAHLKLKYWDYETFRNATYISVQVPKRSFAHLKLKYWDYETFRNATYISVQVPYLDLLFCDDNRVFP